MGAFQDGLRSGVGTLYERPGGSIIYSGEWVSGLYHGEGSCVQLPKGGNQSPDHDSSLQYEGTFFNGLRQGFGMLANKSNGIICKGYWHRDKPVNGKWRITFKDGSIYSGDVKIREEEDASTNSGTRTAIWSNLPESNIPPVSSNFEIRIPLPDGFGAMRYSNGDVYIGTFKDGMRKGSGSLFANGEKLEGVWEDDVLDIDDNGTIASTMNEYSDIHAH